MNFSQAEERFRELKARFTAGDLGEADFKAHLEELMIEDEGGNWWMLGYETERWYRHDGTNWVQQDPPGQVARAGTAPQVEAGRRLEAAAPMPPPARRSPLMLIIAALVVLAVGGYFVFRSAASTAAETSPTPGTSLATSAGPAPVATSSPEPASTPEPSLQPSQTPTPDQIQFFASAAASQVILYKGPDLRYGQVKSYPKGENFAVLARNDDGQWLQVSAADGNKGWVYLQWVDFDFDISLLPTPSVLPPPPPTPTRKPKGVNPAPTCC